MSPQKIGFRFSVFNFLKFCLTSFAYAIFSARFYYYKKIVKLQMPKIHCADRKAVWHKQYALKLKIASICSLIEKVSLRHLNYIF